MVGRLDVSSGKKRLQIHSQIGVGCLRSRQSIWHVNWNLIKRKPTEMVPVRDLRSMLDHGNRCKMINRKLGLLAFSHSSQIVCWRHVIELKKKLPMWTINLFSLYFERCLNLFWTNVLLRKFYLEFFS